MLALWDQYGLLKEYLNTHAVSSSSLFSRLFSGLSLKEGVFFCRVVLSCFLSSIKTPEGSVLSIKTAFPNKNISLLYHKNNTHCMKSLAGGWNKKYKDVALLTDSSSPLHAPGNGQDKRFFLRATTHDDCTKILYFLQVQSKDWPPAAKIQNIMRAYALSSGDWRRKRLFYPFFFVSKVKKINEKKHPHRC